MELHDRHRCRGVRKGVCWPQVPQYVLLPGMLETTRPKHGKMDPSPLEYTQVRLRCSLASPTSSPSTQNQHSPTCNQLMFELPRLLNRSAIDKSDPQSLARNSTVLTSDAQKLNACWHKPCLRRQGSPLSSLSASPSKQAVPLTAFTVLLE